VTTKNNQTTVQLEIGNRILLVDDESDVCFVLQKVLSENGYVVDSYEDPLLALEKFKGDYYSLVILDIKMPKLNGFALYREIKRLDKKVKVFFLRQAKCITAYIQIYFLYYLPIVLFENQLKMKN
jgi:DNA-binding response OmpR family regulator